MVPYIDNNGQDNYFLFMARDNSCSFCQIIEGERKARIVYEDDMIMAFHDINPVTPFHILLIPKKHIRSINDLTEEDGGVVCAMILRARDIAKKAGVSESGYKLVFNTERGAGQVIFHLHLHLIAELHHRHR